MPAVFMLYRNKSTMLIIVTLTIRLYIKPKMHDITILYDVGFAL